MTITLGEHYPDTSQLRVYKTDTDNSTNLIDITNQVSMSNQQVNGTPKTIVSYSLTDGGNFDEDKTQNGTIVDPIYFGLLASASGDNSQFGSQSGDPISTGQSGG